MRLELVTMPLVASLACGVAIAIAAPIILELWDALAKARVQHLLDLGRAVRLDETRIRVGLRLWGLMMAIAPVATWCLFRSIVLVPLAAYLTWRLPAFVLERMVENRRRRLRDQLAPACFALANAARAGLSLPQGVELIGRDASEPLRSILLGMVHDFENGRPFTQVLQDVLQRIDIDSFRMFAAALVSCLEHGGPVTDTLDGIALTIQENQRLEMKMETHSASGRMSLTVLAIFPAVFFLLNYLIDPKLAAVYPSTVLGQVVMSIVIGLVYVSLRIGRRLLRMEQYA